MYGSPPRCVCRFIASYQTIYILHIYLIHAALMWIDWNDLNIDVVVETYSHRLRYISGTWIISIGCAELLVSAV